MMDQSLIIKSSNWEKVKDFWEANDSFKPYSENPIQLNGDGLVYTESSVFSFEGDKVIIVLTNGVVVGCVRLLEKEYGGCSICGLGKMAVHKDYRRNHIGSILLDRAIVYMKMYDFDVSLLWASVLNFYARAGYIPFCREGKELNMMIKYFRPIEEHTKFWLDGVNYFGTW